MTNQLRDIAPERIEQNPENPRMHFPEAGLSKLAESIEESGGVLVPIYVYPHPDAPDAVGTDDERYLLIDGERRWRVALQLGLDAVPALVRDSPPDPAKNIVEMFNIHQVREAWDDMPTAKALQQVIDRTGTTDPDQLKQMTGLSKEQIGRYQLLLELPERYQGMVDSGDVPMNFFVELDRNVIRPLARSRTRLASEYTPDQLRDAFLGKRDAGALDTLIDLRKVKPIIERAVADAGAPDAPSALDDVLRRLIADRQATIEEVYDESIAVAVELDKLTLQARELPRSFARLLDRAEGEAERGQILEALREARDALEALYSEHS